MLKKTLLIAATHGDEKIGLEVIQTLRQQGYGKFFDWLIANPAALNKNQRFIDADLNRAYPGNKNASERENRLAVRNMAIARRYQYVIDIHEASEGYEDFIIIPRPKISTAFPLGRIDLEKILLWPDPPGPLGSVLPQAIELEFGMNNCHRRSKEKRALDIVKKFLEGKRNNKAQQKYSVYGKLLCSQAKSTKLRDWQPAEINGEKFIPLLVNQYSDLGIYCYKMR
ncbi:succinylglutamate desuccinylase/aspartoacylase family protein [Patescibacteria group bacterium]